MSKETFKQCSNTACLKKGPMQSSIPTNVEKTSHVVSSCNVTKRSGQNIDVQKTENSCGDFSNVNNKEIKISRTPKNLASGDHNNKANKVPKTPGDGHKVRRKIHKESSTPTRTETDTVIEYRNENYDDSKSSTASSLCSLIRNKILNTEKSEIEDDVTNTKETGRPVFCPVSNCAKLVAIDSIMSHFYFDHSRIPRTSLVTAEPQDLFVKASSISSETECVAMLLIKILGRQSQISQNSDCVSYVNCLNHNNKLLLLMAAKLHISAVKVRKISDDPENILKTNSTQTNEMDFSKCIETNKNHTAEYKTSFKLNLNKPEIIDNDDVVLLWLCKLHSEEKTYTVIVTREDNKLSYGYTGDAIHIREMQDPLSMYGRPECLIIRGIAINKMLDSSNNINIIVNCTD